MNLIFNGNFGFDISTYQDASTVPGGVDFVKMRDYGASFVIIRAGQGNFIDPDWQTNRNNSRGILPRAPYWFYDPKFDPVEQALLLLSALGDEYFPRVWLDLEFWWDGTYSPPGNWRVFLDAIEDRDYRTGIYTAYYWWVNHAINKHADMNYFGKKALWMAQYNTIPDLIPPGFANPPMLWQNAIMPIGEQVGVESKEIDHDLWNMYYDFTAEWGAVPDGGNNVNSYYKCNTGVLNVRTGPGTSYVDIGDLLQGDHLIVSEIVGGWAHLVDARRGSWEGAPVLLSNGTSVSARATATNDVWCNATYLQTVNPPPSNETNIKITYDDNNVVTGVSVDGVTWAKS